MSIIQFIRSVDKYIFNPIIALMLAVSVAYFIYGIVKFLYAGASEVDKSRKEAQDAILWGIVGMVIMVSVFGIISFVMATFGVNLNDSPDAKTVLTP